MNRHRDLCDRAGVRIKNWDGTPIEEPKPEPASEPERPEKKPFNS